MIPEFSREIRLRQKISEHLDQVLAQNFDADLAGIVILARDPIFVFFLPGGVETILRHP